MNVYLYPIMNRYLVSLGSNENRDENMDKCRQLLKSYFQDITFSEMLETEPFGDDFNTKFYNQLAIISSDCDRQYLSEVLKNIEITLGRKSTHKSEGIVIIDADLLAENGDIIKAGDFERPYIAQLLQLFTNGVTL